MSTLSSPNTYEILKALGYSCAALGRILGLPRKRWSNQLRGVTLVREDEARLVADYVGLPITTLFTEDQIVWEQRADSAAPSRIELAKAAAA